MFSGFFSNWRLFATSAKYTETYILPFYHLLFMGTCYVSRQNSAKLCTFCSLPYFRTKLRKPSETYKFRVACSQGPSIYLLFSRLTSTGRLGEDRGERGEGSGRNCGAFLDKSKLMPTLINGGHIPAILALNSEYSIEQQQMKSIDRKKQLSRFFKRTGRRKHNSKYEVSTTF